MNRFRYEKWKKVPEYYDAQNKIRDVIVKWEEYLSDDSMHETNVVLTSLTDVEEMIEVYKKSAYDLASCLPYTETLRLCMGIYGKVVYGEFKYLHETGELHLCVLHALDVLDPCWNFPGRQCDYRKS